MPKKVTKLTQFRLSGLDKEILARCRDDIALWVHGYFDEPFFPYQEYFYHAPQHDKLLIAGIRTGKSHLVSRGFMHLAQFNAGARLLNTSISSEQAKIVFNKCLEMCNHPNFSHWVEYVSSSPYPMIRLVNKSEIWFRSAGYKAEYLRGFEFDVINFDEVAYEQRKETIDTLKGRLLGINTVTHRHRMGILWMTSSPKGQGWLSERWKKGDPKFTAEAQPDKYLSIRATIFDNPLLNEDLIADIMRDYTDAMINQELYGLFLENPDAVFPYHLVMACCEPGRREVTILNEQIQIWNARNPERARSIRLDAGLTEDIVHYECEPKAGHRYINSWDLGKKPTSEGRNAMVGMVYDITHEPWLQVAYRYSEAMGYVEAKGEMESWHEKYSSNGATCSTVMDSTGKGDVLLEFMEREQTIDDLEGIVYSGATKPNLIHAGKLAIERGLTVFPFIRRQVDQFTGYQIMDKKIAQDIVMTYCQAMYVARQMTRMTDRPPLQQQLNAYRERQSYEGRTSTAKRNPRYIESRLARRLVRTGRGG